MSHAYGQFHVADSPSTLATSLHLHQGETLREVDHEPRNAVLDQEDLIAQGIDTATLIKGAKRVDALGSCTANASMSALSLVLSELDYLTFCKATSYEDTKAIEEAAIEFYAGETHLTGIPADEWPPVDCGSSGPYMFQYAHERGLVSSQRIAHGAQNIVSLLQRDGVLQGGPFLNVWEEPPASGIVDGNGSYATLEEQIAMGVAGGHETYQSAIVKLTLSATGIVEPEKTLLRVRNSWTKSWGDNGSFFIHLSTLVALGGYYDFRQFIA